MSSRQFAIVVLVTTSCSLALMLLLSAALPFVAVLAVNAPPAWAFAPIAGGLAAIGLLLEAKARLANGGEPAALGDLPGRMMFTFGAASIIALLLIASLGPEGVYLRQRPLVAIVLAPVLLFAGGSLLRALVRPPLIAEMARLLGGRASETSPVAPHRAQDFLSKISILAIRPSILLTTTAIATLAATLIGVHTHSQAIANEERLARRHRADLVALAQQQARRLSPAALAAMLDAAPLREEGTMVLARGQRVVAGAGLRGRALIDNIGPHHCQVGSRLWRCAPSARISTGRLYVLQAPRLAQARAHVSNLALLLGLSALIFIVLAGAVGWAMGSDASRDFDAINLRLRKMADDLDLGLPLTVTSIDLVGELTAAVGKLRYHLEGEVENYRQSLRKSQEAEDVKKQFLADVSHELRTPLSTLCGYAQLLLEGVEGELDERQRDDIQVIYDSGQQLLSLVNDVLDMSVIESGNLELNFEPIDAAKIAEEVVKAQRATSRAKADENQDPAVEIVYRAPAALPPVQADSKRLRQVIQNLVANAAKFTRQGTIAVSLDADNESLMIKVEDTGEGISAIDLPRVFDEYRQAGSLSARRKGSGLGLAICKHVVERHLGTISVQSEVGAGSTFAVCLPLEQPRAKERR